jgi:histidinol-phosphate aminotransferase
LRVGYGIAQPALTDLLNRVRQPFNVNAAAQAAAIAALGDHEFLAKSYALNLAGMQQLVTAFQSLQLDFVPSYGNFILVKVGPAARVYAELLKRGVIVRPVAGYGLPEWLRITVGLPEENERFIDALAAALQAANA